MIYSTGERSPAPSYALVRDEDVGRERLDEVEKRRYRFRSIGGGHLTAEPCSLLKITFISPDEAREWFAEDPQAGPTAKKITKQLILRADIENSFIILKPGWVLDNPKEWRAKGVVFFNFKDAGMRIFLPSKGILKIENVVGVAEKEQVTHHGVTVFVSSEKAFLIESILNKMNVGFRRSGVELVGDRHEGEEKPTEDLFEFLIPINKSDLIGVEFWKMVQESGLQKDLKVNVYFVLPSEIDDDGPEAV